MKEFNDRVEWFDKNNIATYKLRINYKHKKRKE